MSFDKRVYFYKKWKYLIPAILITGTFFIVWDVWFTKIGVWSFNEDHLLGISFVGLPVEEHLFFFTIPYASIFIYETIKSYWPHVNPNRLANPFFLILAIMLLATAGLFINRLYPSITFTLLGVFIFITLFVIRANYLGRFLISYGIIIIPFLIFNGILTGTGLEQPVVLYNNQQNMALRIGTIPFEDLFYGMLLILMNISLFEIFRKEHRNN